MVRLFALVTGDDPRDIADVQFPVVSVPTDPAKAETFDGAKVFASRLTVAKARKYPAFSGLMARIEELQPYNNANPSIWGMERHGFPRYHALPAALDRLIRLDNVDKHRVIHPTWHSVVHGWGPGHPAEFKHIGSTVSGINPLEDGAEVGRQRFQTPSRTTGSPRRWT